MHIVASYRRDHRGYGQAVFMGKECKEGQVQPESKQYFIGLRMGRDSWQMFICQQGWLEAGWSKMVQWDSLFQFRVVAHHSSDKACPQQLCQGPKREDRIVQSVSQLRLRSCMKSCSLYAVPQSKSPAQTDLRVKNGVPPLMGKTANNCGNFVSYHRCPLWFCVKNLLSSI